MLTEIRSVHNAVLRRQAQHPSGWGKSEVSQTKAVGRSRCVTAVDETPEESAELGSLVSFCPPLSSGELDTRCRSAPGQTRAVPHRTPEPEATLGHSELPLGLGPQPLAPQSLWHQASGDKGPSSMKSPPPKPRNRRLPGLCHPKEQCYTCRAWPRLTRVVSTMKVAPLARQEEQHSGPVGAALLPGSMGLPHAAALGCFPPCSGHATGTASGRVPPLSASGTLEAGGADGA